MEEKEAQPSYDIASENKNFKKFVMKEILDKIGFGFCSQQFVNVLFFLTGASFFLVGIVNGLKVVLSILVGNLAQEYNKLKGISKRIIGFSGIIFGFSFLLMSFGKLLNSKLIFSIAVVISGISLVIYGDYSKNFFLIDKRKETLEKIAKYGLIVTAASLFLSAFLLDKYGEGSLFMLNILGKTFVIKLTGYIVAFEIAAMSFMIAGYFLASARDKTSASSERFSLASFFSNLKQKYREIFQNKFMLMLLVFNIAAGLVQVVGNSYYGIFIYQNYKEFYFGGFMNIAMVFLIGVFSSLVGYSITRINTRSYGAISMLAAGGLFLSAMPFVYYLGTNLAYLTAGTIIGVIGASALGISVSMLVIEGLHEKDRKDYYVLNGIFSIAPYIIFIPMLSYVAQSLSLNILFLILSIILTGFTVITLFSYAVSRKQVH